MLNISLKHRKSKNIMKKILLLLALAVLPFIISYGAKLPTQGYAGPYFYHIEIEAGFGHLEGDILFDEDVVTFDRSAGRFVVAADGFDATACGVAIGDVCQYCEDVSEECMGYLICTTALGACAAGVPNVVPNQNAICCDFIASGMSCGQISLGEGVVMCPIGGNVAILLIFALPYAIIRLWRKRKMSWALILLKLSKFPRLQRHQSW